MSPRPDRIAAAVLDRYPATYGEELGIHSPGTPSGLFRILVMASLMGARIRASVAVDAARALSKKRWNTPKAMVGAGWEARTHVLNRSGYARYDESTSRTLGDAAQLLLDDYRGDLRRLREAAGRDPKAERARLQDFKGIGPTSADIFCREAQRAWDELYPFADRRALRAAGRLGLGHDVAALADLVSKQDFPRLVDGLVRTDLDKAFDEVRAGV